MLTTRRAAGRRSRSGDADVDDLPFVDPEDIAILLFTSGTTGEPKAAVLRHRHLTSYILGTRRVPRRGGGRGPAGQRAAVPHRRRLGGAELALQRRRIVYLPAFDAEEWVRTVDDEAVTQAMVVPTMLGRILDGSRRRAPTLTSLRHLSYGGGRMPVELIERAMAMLPDVDFVNAYGLTETSSTISVLTPDDHREASASDDPAVRGGSARSAGRCRRSSWRSATPTARCCRPASGARSTCGASRWRGSTSAAACSPTTAGSRPTTPATSTSDGFLYLEGRLDDVIVRGAENLSPGEIEDDAARAPGGRRGRGGRRARHRVGRGGRRRGRPRARARTVTEDELQAVGARARCARRRRPSCIEFRDELPYNETGKLLRRVLRSELTTANEARTRDAR